MKAKRLAGRPREDAIDAAIRRAAYQLLEEGGYRRFTIEAVARRAKVSKPSIYRRWPRRGDLLLDALVAETAANLPVVSSGELRKDLYQLLSASFRRLATPAGKVVRSLLVESQLDEEFRERFRMRFIEARRAGVRSLLELAVSRGEIPTTVNRELLIDFFYGVLWYRLLLAHAPMDDQCAADVADHICRAAGAHKRKG